MEFNLKDWGLPGRGDTLPPKEIYGCHLEIKPVCHLFSPDPSGEKKRRSGKCQNDPDHLEILPTRGISQSPFPYQHVSRIKITSTDLFTQRVLSALNIYVRFV